MRAKLLCVGDIHLGRRPARMPDGLADHGIDAAALGPAAAWRATVERAEAERVDAVLLAGDVVDHDDDFFEAYPLLQAGVERLVRAGIDVVAVAGNHDVRVLPRLADAVPQLHLLGRGGRWEEHVVVREGRPAARIVGWSFPQADVVASPLAAFVPPADRTLPTLGLLHCDLDQSPSRYAPVRRAELEQAGLDAWLLGHVHAPSPLADARPAGYLGSLVGLDPTESGRHGPWRLTIDDGGLHLAQLPLAPLRWERLVLGVGDVDDAGALPVALVRAVEVLHAALGGEAPRAVGVDVVLRGPNRLGPALAAAAEQLRRHDAQRCGDTIYFVHAVTDDTAPAQDLAALARGTDPAGGLARLLRLLDAPPDDPDRQELLAGAQAALDRERARPAWRHLGRGPLPEAAVVALLRRAGAAALESLLATRREADA